MGAKESRFEDIQVGRERLGAGQFGEVFKGVHLPTKRTIAVKKCPLGDDDKLDMALKEIKALDHVPRHENVVQIIAFVFTEQTAFIAMEFCELGNLESFAKRKKRMSNTEKFNVMYQCANGLEFMHTLPQPVAHRDLKPPNILMTMQGGQPIAKIGDFGLAKVVDDQTILKTVMGTMLYMAPEMFKRENYTTAVDVFAMGLLYLALLRYEEIGELIPLPGLKEKQKNSRSVCSFYMSVRYFSETTSDLRRAESYGMKIATLGGLLGHDVPIQFVVRKPSDSDDVNVVKAVVEAMLISVPRMRMKIGDVKKHLGSE